MQNLRKIVDCKNFAQIYLCINMAPSCAWFLKFWFEFYRQKSEYNTVNTNIHPILGKKNFQAKYFYNERGGGYSGHAL